MAAAYIARYENPDLLARILPRALLDLLDAEDATGIPWASCSYFP
jgi:hypothetical protein